jgi:hypothetical protein
MKGVFQSSSKYPPCALFFLPKHCQEVGIDCPERASSSAMRIADSFRNLNKERYMLCVLLLPS